MLTLLLVEHQHRRNKDERTTEKSEQHKVTHTTTTKDKTKRTTDTSRKTTNKKEQEHSLTLHANEHKSKVQLNGTKKDSNSTRPTPLWVENNTKVIGKQQHANEDSKQENDAQSNEVRRVCCAVYSLYSPNVLVHSDIGDLYAIRYFVGKFLMR